MSIKICVIGCGNISNSRHIPAIKRNKDVDIVGLISNDQKKIERTKKRHSDLRNVNSIAISDEKDAYTQLLEIPWFVNDIDAVIIGTPPKQHFPVVEACLKTGKHVLVEKPMMMSVDECDRVIALSREKKLVLGVMHSFQFSNGMMKLERIVKDGKLGEIQSILELQLSNRDRRLPVWYNDLPLGLFYDEAAHFFYCARKFGGQLKVLNANAVFNKNDNTPKFLEAQLVSGTVPVQMYMNFNSPICEWGIVIIGKKRIAIYDYFKDILIVLDNDGQHLAKNVLKTSLGFSLQFWKGFIKNGFDMIGGRLLYGHDVCINKFLNAIKDNQHICNELSAELGREVVGAMNEVVVYAKEK